MGEAFHVLQGTLLTACMHLCLWLGAFSLAAVVPAISLADRLLIAFAVATSQAVVITLFASAIGQLSPFVVGILNLFCCAALYGFSRVLLKGPKNPFKFFSAFLEALYARLKAEPIIAFALVPTLTFYLLLFSYAATRPPMGYDPLNYHLTIAATAIQSGTFEIVFFPPYFDLYAWFPANGAVFSIWTMLWMGCDLWVCFVNVPFLLALFLSLYLVARYLDVPRLPAILFSGLFSTLPMFAMLGSEAYVELPLWAMFFAALRLCLISAGGQGPFWPVAALSGVIVGTKTTGFLLALLLLATFTIFGFKRVRFAGACRALALFIGGVIAFGSYFYIRNFFACANPLYPLPVSILGREIFPGQPDLGERLMATSAARHFDVLWRSGKLIGAIIGEVFTPNSSWGLGPPGLAVLLGAPITLVYALFARPWQPKLIWLGLVGVFVIASWFFGPYSGKFVFSNVRFAYPGVVLLGVSALSLVVRPFAQHLWMVSGVLLFLQTVSFFFANISVTLGSGVLAALCGTVAFIGATFSRRLPLLPRSAVRRTLAFIGILLLVLMAVYYWHRLREQTRISSYREATAPYQLQVAEYADCLAAVERFAPIGRLAVALEPWRRGFIFPLFGSHLQRQVFYVHNGPEESRLHCDYPYGNPRRNPDHASWLRHLGEMRPTALLVFLDPVENEVPIESHWAQEEPELFRRKFSSEKCELYLIDSMRLP